MDMLFIKVLNMSISASWLVLAVLVLRLVLKKAPKWVSVLLWGFVAIRLLLPVSLESVFSLIPNTETDAKHSPVIRVHKKHASPEECCRTPDTEPCCTDGACEQYCVEVGQTHHPMEDDHAIRWIYLQTNVGGHRKCLSPGGKPSACFALTEEKPTAVYAYCDKHGLYMTEL